MMHGFQKPGFRNQAEHSIPGAPSPSVTFEVHP